MSDHEHSPASEGNRLKRTASADSGGEAQHRSKNACVRGAQEGNDEIKARCWSAPDKAASAQDGQVVELAAFANSASFAAGAPLRNEESTGDPHGDDSEPDSPRVALLVGSVPEPAGDLDAGPGFEPTAAQHDQGAPLGAPGTTSEALMQDSEENAAKQQQEAHMRAESAGQVVRDGVTAPAVPSEQLQEQRGQVVPHNTTADDAAAAHPAAAPAPADATPTAADAGLAADAPASAVAAPAAVAAAPAAAAAVVLADAGFAPDVDDTSPAPDNDDAGPAPDDDDASIEDDDDNDDDNGDDDDDNNDDEEAAILAEAHAYSAHLAEVHQAAWGPPRQCRRWQWAALIAPDRLWDTCPGPGQCSIVLDTETSGLPRWVRVCTVLPTCYH